MPTPWSTVVCIEWTSYGSRVICVNASKMDKFKFSGTDEDSFSVAKDTVNSSGHTPEDSNPVADSDDSNKEAPRDGSVIPEEKKCTKISSVGIHSIVSRNRESILRTLHFAILVFALMMPCVTASSTKPECWDRATNCSVYKNNQYCKPGLDKTEHHMVSFLFERCQKTCICDKPTEGSAKDNLTHCQDLQHDPECLQRPPAEVFRNECASTCYYSRTPYLEHFQTSPKNKTFKKGMNLTLECSINSTNPRVNITWYKNNVPIGLDEKVSSASKLTIFRADASDEGHYHCRATNSDYGLVLSVESRNGTLTLEKEPNNAGLKPGVAIVVTVLFVAVIAASVFGMWKLWKKKRRNEETKKMDEIHVLMNNNQ